MFLYKILQMDEDVYDGRVKEFLLQFITIYIIRRNGGI